MVDVFSKEKRSKIMSRVKGRGNLATEVRLLRMFRDHRITGWRRHVPLMGTPDFVFPTSRLVVFVDGCFWHGCPTHGSLPASNREFWKRKLDGNKKRDRQVRDALRKSGWRVLQIWQHELKEPQVVMRKLNRSLGRRLTA